MIRTNPTMLRTIWGPLFRRSPNIYNTVALATAYPTYKLAQASCWEMGNLLSALPRGAVWNIQEMGSQHTFGYPLTPETLLLKP